MRLRTRPPRAGMTLVELLVVLALIAVLVALSGSVYQRVLRTQREKNADALIEKLTVALESQKKAFLDQMAKRDLTGDNTYMALLAANGGDAAKARAAYVQALLPLEFPNTFQAAAQNPKYQKFLAACGYQGSPPSPQEAQESACLLLALTQARGNNAFQPDAALESSALAPVPGMPKMQYVLDPWGKPLRYMGLTNNTDTQGKVWSTRG